MNTLPPDFYLRPITMEDLQSVTDLLVACDLGDYGKPTSSRATLEADTHSSWEAPDMNLATNVRVVLAPDGTYAGSATLLVPHDAPEQMYASPVCIPRIRDSALGPSSFGSWNNALVN